jgi:hypothetical protein
MAVEKILDALDKLPLIDGDASWPAEPFIQTL